MAAAAAAPVTVWRCEYHQRDFRTERALNDHLKSRAHATCVIGCALCRTPLQAPESAPGVQCPYCNTLTMNTPQSRVPDPRGPDAAGTTANPTFQIVAGPSVTPGVGAATLAPPPAATTASTAPVVAPSSSNAAAAANRANGTDPSAETATPAATRAPPAPVDPSTLSPSELAARFAIPGDGMLPSDQMVPDNLMCHPKHKNRCECINPVGFCFYAVFAIIFLVVAIVGIGRAKGVTWFYDDLQEHYSAKKPFLSVAFLDLLIVTLGGLLASHLWLFIMAWTKYSVRIAYWVEFGTGIGFACSLAVFVHWACIFIAVLPLFTGLIALYARNSDLAGVLYMRHARIHLSRPGLMFITFILTVCAIVASSYFLVFFVIFVIGWNATAVPIIIYGSYVWFTTMTFFNYVIMMVAAPIAAQQYYTGGTPNANKPKNFHSCNALFKIVPQHLGTALEAAMVIPFFDFVVVVSAVLEGEGALILCIPAYIILFFVLAVYKRGNDNLAMNSTGVIWASLYGVSFGDGLHGAGLALTRDDYLEKSREWAPTGLIKFISSMGSGFCAGLGGVFLTIILCGTEAKTAIVMSGLCGLFTGAVSCFLITAPVNAGIMTMFLCMTQYSKQATKSMPDCVQALADNWPMACAAKVTKSF